MAEQHVLDFGTFCFDDFGLLTQNLTALTRVDLADASSRDLPAPSSAQAHDQSPVDSAVLFVDKNGLEATRNEGNDPPRLVVDAPSLAALDGSTLDFVREGLKQAFKWENPNVDATCGCGESFSVNGQGLGRVRTGTA